MKTFIVWSGALLLFVHTQPLSAEPAGNGREEDLATMRQKLMGTWEGKGGCDGRLVFRADGTYELSDYGPAGHKSKGTWKVRWDSLPATLALTCKSSDIQDEVGQTREVKLIGLDDTNLTIAYPNPNGSPSGKYARAKK
jgi:hypothetical protein